MFFPVLASASTIAVTDLTYSQRVEGYIHVVDYHNKSNVHAKSSTSLYADPYTGIASHSENLSAKSKTDFFEYEHQYSYIEVGELRGFIGDIKGEIIKSNRFKIVQAKPMTTKKDETPYDIIDRIKKGYYPGADYVLFGIVNDISFDNDSYTAQNSTLSTITLSLTLTVEFSLISTKTYQVIAGFSAQGSGSNSKIWSPRATANPNRSIIISEVSKSLGRDVGNQITKQINNQSDAVVTKTDNEKENNPNETDVIIFH